jgi:hypothetical protein
MYLGFWRFDTTFSGSRTEACHPAGNWIQTAITIDMKLTIAFLSIIVALSFGACSTAKKPTREVTLVACCASNEPDKDVLLQDSFEPGGRVVRLAPH